MQASTSCKTGLYVGPSEVPLPAASSSTTPLPEWESTSSTQAPPRLHTIREICFVDTYNAEMPSIDCVLKHKLVVYTSPYLSGVAHCHPKTSDMIAMIYAPNAEINSLATLYANVKRCQNHFSIFKESLTQSLRTSAEKTPVIMEFLDKEVNDHQEITGYIIKRLDNLSEQGRPLGRSRLENPLPSTS